LFQKHISLIKATKSHIPEYTLYHTMRLDGKAHGDTALIIRSDIKHYEITKYQREFLQATSIMVENQNGNITISAVCSSPKHAIKRKHYIIFFKTLDNQFIAADVYNTKHTYSGSRLILPKKLNELFNAIEDMNLAIMSTGKLTYWSSDNKRILDLLDFGIIRDIPKNFYRTDSCLELF